ncbi:2-C-methyl-D-erythritol 4-phosphate cytidylyltransferase [Salsuginibacillus kocurii]|uniref:2-C-methyl-D-erythritol 4-phosphate cytidylyltransferase n=1 Tax=Salsuginibacillus kocurii TaxID=427078 RepID=UPI00036DDD3F|nr:2-C-methyl-D-erythritol 4-phosphate cytidylyltransferase [Salsuginibacillus kocurii]
MSYAVIIPAAGQGKRMKAGLNKQFLHLRQLPLIIRTLRVFEQDEHCEEVIVVVNPEETEEMAVLFAEHGIQKVTNIVSGGKERQDSVYEGLKQVRSQEVVMVHDGARPFVTKERIHALEAEAKNSGGAVLAVPVTDTIKRASNSRVEETLARSELWAAQTPQAFKFEVLMDAYAQAVDQGFQGTDDSGLVEWNGYPVAIVEGDYDNIKLTTPEDMVRAEAIIQKREESPK